MDSFHQKLVETRKEIYFQLKKSALEIQENASEELLEYYSAQEAYQNIDFKEISLNKFIEKINQSNIIYLGDFHSFDQSSKNLQRLLKILLSEERKIMIGLEMISFDQQDKINSFLNGHLTEKEFLQSINYKESWRFPWSHYREFFKLAKSKNISVHGLNSVGSLEERDQKASEVISKVFEKNRDHIFIVLFGELHIIPDKLPAKVSQSLLGSKVQSTPLIIHQNLDEIYWKLAKESILDNLDTKIIQIRENELSLQSSPPWIKLESYIYWFENIINDPEFDMHEYSIESGLKTFNNNVYEDFSYLCQKICNSLNIEITLDNIEDYNLYDHQSLEYILKASISSNSKDFILSLIKNNHFFKFPDSNILYCPSYSINRLTYLAGLHIFYCLNKDIVFEKLSDIEKLTYLINQFSFSYFSTKIFNPYLKCALYSDLSNIVNTEDQTQETSKKAKADHLSLDILDQTFSPQQVMNLCDYTKYLIGRNIGNVIGEFLFLNFSKTEEKIIKQVLLQSTSEQIRFQNINKILEIIKESNKDFYTRTKKVF